MGVRWLTTLLPLRVWFGIPPALWGTLFALLNLSWQILGFLSHVTLIQNAQPFSYRGFDLSNLRQHWAYNYSLPNQSAEGICVKDPLAGFPRFRFLLLVLEIKVAHPATQTSEALENSLKLEENMWFVLACWGVKTPTNGGGGSVGENARSVGTFCGLKDPTVSTKVWKQLINGTWQWKTNMAGWKMDPLIEDVHQGKSTWHRSHVLVYI